MWSSCAWVMTRPSSSSRRFGDELRVWHHDLDLRQLRAAEADAAVHGQPAAVAAIQVEVHADLARPAEGQEGESAGFLVHQSLSVIRVLSRGNVGAGLRSANSRSPSSVRSGSIRSNTVVPSPSSGASPPVAITLSGWSNSARMRATSPSTRADVAPVDAGLHGRHRGAADHRLRPADADPRQAGGRLVQRLERQVDARRDHAADVGAVRVHHVEAWSRCRSPPPPGAPEAGVRRQRVHQPVRADLGRVVHPDVGSPSPAWSGPPAAPRRTSRGTGGAGGTARRAPRCRSPPAG